MADPIGTCIIVKEQWLVYVSTAEDVLSAGFASGVVDAFLDDAPTVIKIYNICARIKVFFLRWCNPS